MSPYRKYDGADRPIGFDWRLVLVKTTMFATVAMATVSVGLGTWHLLTRPASAEPEPCIERTLNPDYAGSCTHENHVITIKEQHVVCQCLHGY